MKRILFTFAAALVFTSAALAQNTNFSWTNSKDHASCNEMRVTSDDFQIQRAEQRITVAANEVRTLQLAKIGNGAVMVYGWNQPNYEVVACKVGFGSNDAEAKQMLDAIQVQRNGDTITTTGPEHNSEEMGEVRWSVHYLVHVPANGSFAAITHNGPLSASGIRGTLNLRSHNGPVTLKNCSGDLTAETTNGPVSFSGSAGKVSLITENGPVSLQLESSQWDGDVTASTHNGPMQLWVPKNFETAFLVEGGAGPLSCSHAICDRASTTREHGHSRVEFGSSPRIKATTDNGPVTVSVLKADI